MNVFRRKYFIYPEIQLPLLKIVLTLFTVVTALQCLLIFLSMKWLENKVQVDLSLVVDFRVFGSWRKLLYFSIIIPIIFNFLFSIFVVLFISNKFAGPLFRLERELDLFLNGTNKDLSVNFRKNDYLHSLSVKINRLNSKYRD